MNTKKKKVHTKTKKDQAWDKVFDELQILKQVRENSRFRISANAMKELGLREPRLMAKNDRREVLPSVMRDNGLAVFAVGNGVYEIAKWHPFIAIEPMSTSNIEYVQIPNMETLRLDHRLSESEVLDLALHGGVMAAVFREKVALTVRGRRRCPPIDFMIGDMPVHADGVQVEVDGGYEGEKAIYLVEAKIGRWTNVNLRQIVLAHKMWEQEMKGKKEVKSFVFIHENSILRVFEIVCRQGVWMADHENERCFKFVPGISKAKFDILAINEQPLPVFRPQEAPFPQADRLETVVDMLLTINGAAKSTVKMDNLANRMRKSGHHLVPRQIGYYASALTWLGLARRTRGSIALTNRGLNVASMSDTDRLEALAEIILSDPLFHHALHEPETAPPEDAFGSLKLSESTKVRRFQTAKAWVKYLRNRLRYRADERLATATRQTAMLASGAFVAQPDSAAPSLPLSTEPLPHATIDRSRDTETTLADQLRLVRSTLRLSVSELARVLRVTRPTICQWQRGGASSEPHAQRVRDLATAIEPHAVLFAAQHGRLAHRALEGRKTVLSLLCDNRPPDIVMDQLSALLTAEARQRERMLVRLQGRSPQVDTSDTDLLG